jgi:hypothetical protein
MNRCEKGDQADVLDGSCQEKNFVKKFQGIGVPFLDNPFNG